MTLSAKSSPGIQDRENRNEAAQEHEALAIIGIGCRFPGDANDPETYWSILQNGVDAPVEVPPDRWDLRMYYDPEPGKPGKTNVRHGGFVKNIDRFDANFFGISPREASRMDPQQRLILEVGWEALEDGGQVLERLSGSSTGVFVGMSSFDYSLAPDGFPRPQCGRCLHEHRRGAVHRRQPASRTASISRGRVWSWTRPARRH